MYVDWGEIPSVHHWYGIDFVGYWREDRWVSSSFLVLTTLADRDFNKIMIGFIKVERNIGERYC